jgi:malonate decarboxylase alpha subunit
MTPTWTTRRDEKRRRLSAIEPEMRGSFLPTKKIVPALETLVASGDRIVIEGDNQKQADFLSRSLAKVDPERIRDLHLIISSISRPEHLTLFELGIAGKVDFAFAGPQSLRLAQLLEDGKLTIGAIHTYVELYARLFVDLSPNVVLVCAEQGDKEGNIYTGPNTEDTPVIVEAAAFHDGIVIVQVNEIVDQLPRVDIPASWIDVVVEADQPFAVEPLFTRDPRQIDELQILIGMLVIRGIYERHQVRSLNHGIGFDTAAIELLLPTYGESLGLRGKICEYWALNPHPTLIPAIESGWVKGVRSFGSEVGMDRYVAARPNIFFTGRDGSLRSNRVVCQLAGQYAVDAFIGSTLQWTRRQTRQPVPVDASPASAEHRTWAMIRMADAITARRGRSYHRENRSLTAGRSLPRPLRLFRKVAFPRSWRHWTPSRSASRRGCPSHPS